MIRGAAMAFGLWASMAAAAPVDLSHLDTEALRAVLLQGGLNERADERHEVTVEGCLMTTFWWKKQEGDGWVLWSSFQFSMPTAELQEDPGAPGEYGFLVPGSEFEEDDEDMVLFFFEMTRGQRARYEVPFARRTPRHRTEPSPRGDGTTHFYDTSKSFFIRHEGPGIAKRARQFGAAYVEWVERYCLLAG